MNDMIRVAIIEDDPVTVEMLTSAIAAADDITVVAVARSTQSGLLLVKEGGFDVLLCDLGLPDGTGITLIAETSRRYPDTDIIVITIFADQANVLASIKAGARGYILKDERFDDCVAGIREIRRGGSPISPIIARQLLQQLQPSRTGKGVSEGEGLSPREAEVLGLLARGFSYAEIAGLLTLSPQTVGTHVKNLYRKLEVNSRSEAVFEASSRGIMGVH
ncbi:response regulator transcription factor [Sphingosinicellaceae bacterium]|nr:response regulator transcription factor [Sphingosinicellaceae bacterium]